MFWVKTYTFHKYLSIFNSRPTLPAVERVGDPNATLHQHINVPNIRHILRYTDISIYIYIKKHVTYIHINISIYKYIITSTHSMSIYQYNNISIYQYINIYISIYQDITISLYQYINTNIYQYI